MALNLTKGTSLNLKKENGHRLTQFCVGLNWGAIPKKGFLGFGTRYEAVDLDGSVALFDAENKCQDVVYYHQLVSHDHAIRHSGDELTGDNHSGDKIDNEVITLDLSRVKPNIEQIVFILNSYKGQDFATIPYAHLRLFEGNKGRVKSIFAEFNVSSDMKFNGYVSMIMGKLYKKGGEWHFHTIGEPTRDATLHQTIQTAQKMYL
jgi:tellurium resistance protein TerZ